MHSLEDGNGRGGAGAVLLWLGMATRGEAPLPAACLLPAQPLPWAWLHLFLPFNYRATPPPPPQSHLDSSLYPARPRMTTAAQGSHLPPTSLCLHLGGEEHCPWGNRLRIFLSLCSPCGLVQRGYVGVWGRDTRAIQTAPLHSWCSVAASAWHLGCSLRMWYAASSRFLTPSEK